MFFFNVCFTGKWKSASGRTRGGSDEPTRVAPLSTFYTILSTFTIFFLFFFATKTHKQTQFGGIMWGIKSADYWLLVTTETALQHFLLLVLVTPSGLQVLLIKRCRIVERMMYQLSGGKSGFPLGGGWLVGCSEWEQWAWPDNAYGTANICNKTKSGNHDNDQQINTAKKKKRKTAK